MQMKRVYSGLLNVRAWNVPDLETHVRELLELFSGGIPSDANLEKLGSEYEARAEKVFAHFNFLNTGIYHLFFSRTRLSKLATHHVLRAWAEEPELVDRLGRLFGGLDLDTPQMNEVFELWGLDLPDFYPLRASSARVPLHKVLVPLMKISNHALRVREERPTFAKIRQGVSRLPPVSRLTSALRGRLGSAEYQK